LLHAARDASARRLPPVPPRHRGAAPGDGGDRGAARAPPGELAPFSQGTQIVWGTQRSVIKLFVPTWPEDARIEMLMLERLVGTGLPVPQLEARGEIAGWPYVVMSRLPGQRVSEEWPGLDADARERLSRDIGAAMTRLAALPVTGLDALRAPQESLLAERRPRLLQDQRERGGDDALEAQLKEFLDTLPPLLPAESVLMHADLTADNILVHDSRLAGFIDFADAFVGPWTHELAATSCFVRQGDRRSQRRFSWAAASRRRPSSSSRCAAGPCSIATATSRS
jgi:hygromycin-B 7''-O-kinase